MTSSQMFSYKMDVLLFIPLALSVNPFLAIHWWTLLSYILIIGQVLP